MRELRAKPAVDALMTGYRERVSALKERGITPTLAVVRVGEREDDLAYERGILKRFEQAGAAVRVFERKLEAGQQEMEELIRGLDSDKDIHGILMFRPLPASLDEDVLRNLVSPAKDADCMSDLGMAHVFAQDSMGYPPCTPEAVMALLDFYEIPLKGARVCVVGRSMVVGRPLAMLLMGRHATVTICHTRTKDLEAECRRADIICAAAGSAGMIGAAHVREGQIVMDVGINVVKQPVKQGDGQDAETVVEEKLCGDVDYEAVSGIVEGITPVPGGVGGMTTTMLLGHVISAAQAMAC